MKTKRTLAEIQRQIDGLLEMKKSNIDMIGRRRFVYSIITKNEVNMKKLRIVKRIELGGAIWFYIQEKTIFGNWRDCKCLQGTTVGYETLEEAKKRICYYDGSKPKEEVVYEHRNEKLDN